MNDPNLYRVPAEVDHPIPIFAWDVVEIVVAVLMFGVFIILGYFLFGMVAAMVTLSMAKKLKKGAKRGQAQHLIWRAGLVIDQPLKRHAPHPIKLEFIP